MCQNDLYRGTPSVNKQNNKKHTKRKLVQDPQIEKQIAGAKLEYAFVVEFERKSKEKVS